MVPLWLYIFNPFVMSASILIVLLLNFSLLLIVSFSTNECNHMKFAVSKLMSTFICAVITHSVGYIMMTATFILSDEMLQNGLLKCDYSSINVLKIPLISIFISVLFGYILSRFILFGKSGYDSITRTALCC